MLGEVLDALEESAYKDNTIVVFLTDNGSIMGIKYFNAGMRGMKTELWDGGHRVPCFINWPLGNFKNIGEEVLGLKWENAARQINEIYHSVIE